MNTLRESRIQSAEGAPSGFAALLETAKATLPWSSSPARGLCPRVWAALDSRPPTVDRAEDRCATGLFRALLVAAILASPAFAVGQYLAVFVDGRILPVAGARLVREMQIRLELSGGGSIEVPLSRLDRVIEDEVEPLPQPIPKPSCDPAFSAATLPAGTPFAAEIVAAGKAAGLHPRLVAAVVAAESAFNRFAISRVGAGGLMQLMPSVWLPERVTDPYDPSTNLRLGSRHLKSLLDRFGDLTLALAAYNAGIATVERSGGIPPYRETRDFVRRVLARFCPSRE